MKNLILIFIFILGFGTMVSYSQVEFYKIGSKWVYENQPCNGTLHYDTIISEKDTVVSGMNLRKLKYTNIDSSFLFLVTTTGVFRYDKDTLRKIFPLNLKLNDTVLSDLTYATTLLGWGYQYKYFRLKAVCTNLITSVFGTDTIKTFTIKFDSNSTTNSSVRHAVLVSTAQVLYNNIFGDLLNVIYPPPINLASIACGSVTLLNFKNEKYKYDNGSWKLNTVTSISMNDYSSNINLIIYPNPSEGYVEVKNLNENSGELTYELADILGCIVDNGKLIGFGQIEFNSLKSGIYFLIIIENNKTVHNHKIIIK